MLILLVFTSCAPHKPPIVINKLPDARSPSPTPRSSNEHIVSKGETLYSIAWGVGQDFHTLAKWNEIHDPYTIYPGQVIKLTPPETKRKSDTSTLSSKSPQKSETNTAISITSNSENDSQVVKSSDRSEPASMDVGSVSASNPVKRWRWPSKGKVVERYRPAVGVNGIRISAAVGSPINAAAEGEVVYVGEGLRGYGKLVLIKHNTTFLSAYAHNESILVSEGQEIEGGQLIAKMGSSGTTKTMLHFEIRKDGKPVDPLDYLN